ncbi:MAG TPA: hypothetical protein PLV13_00165 [Ilumatobacteraceae bacterium]|nr:hypothetical protein [Ilumatobacteraceae bacterium]
MFTTGSKLFFGASTLALVSAIVYAACTSGPLSSAGTVGLLSASLVFALLGGVNYANRDCNVSAMDPAAGDAAASKAPAANSMWPAVAALAVAGLAVGAVSRPAVFKVAVVLVLVGVAEWAALSGRTKAARSGSRVMPLEIPILVVALVAAVIYAL